MVVRLPEMKKYLNRDGLEEYNSLLPHSSAEMQEYVDTWLEAHPEATTTVQDGSITAQKLAAKCVTRDKLADDVTHLLGGMMLTKDVQGELITAHDVWDIEPLALTIDGKSTQDGTPTPDAPVPIESIEMLSLPVTFAGKNLLNLRNRTVVKAPSFSNTNPREMSESYVYDGITQTNYGGPSNVSYTESNGTYTVTATSNGYGVGLPMPVMPNTLYCASSSGVIGVGFYDADGAFLSGIGGLSTTIAFTTPAVCKWVMLVLRPPANVTTTYSNIQIELGATATSYESYNATTAQIPMQGHVLRSLPDGTKDTMALTYLRPSTREGWAWYARELVQRVHQETFDGSEPWTRMAKTGGTGYYFHIPNYTAIPLVKPTLSVNAGTQMWDSYAIGNPYSTQTGAYAWIFKDASWSYNTIRCDTPDAEIDTADEFKAWLAEHPVTVIYELATPVTTQLDPVELPVLPAPTCTVWSDPTTGLKMTYMRNSNIVVSDIEQAIADL